MTREEELWAQIEELQERLSGITGGLSRQTADAIHERFHVMKEGQGREQDALLLALGLSDGRRAEAERESLRLRLSAAISNYAGEWVPEWRVPLGWMECDGRQWFAGRTDGPHLRPIGRRERIEVVRDGMRPSPNDYLPFPRVRDGEEVMETIGSLVVRIVQVLRRGGEYWEPERITPCQGPLGRR